MAADDDGAERHHPLLGKYAGAKARIVKVMESVGCAGVGFDANGRPAWRRVDADVGVVAARESHMGGYGTRGDGASDHGFDRGIGYEVGEHLIKGLPK